MGFEIGNAFYRWKFKTLKVLGLLIKPVVLFFDSIRSLFIKVIWRFQHLKVGLKPNEIIDMYWTCLYELQKQVPTLSFKVRTSGYTIVLDEKYTINPTLNKEGIYVDVKVPMDLIRTNIQTKETEKFKYEHWEHIYRTNEILNSVEFLPKLTTLYSACIGRNVQSRETKGDGVFFNKDNSFDSTIGTLPH